MQLGTILMRKQLISRDQLERGLVLQSHTAKRLGELLLEEGAIADTQLEEALKEQFWRESGYWVID